MHVEAVEFTYWLWALILNQTLSFFKINYLLIEMSLHFAHNLIESWDCRENFLNCAINFVLLIFFNNIILNFFLCIIIYFYLHVFCWQTSLGKVKDKLLSPVSKFLLCRQCHRCLNCIETGFQNLIYLLHLIHFNRHGQPRHSNYNN